MYCVLRSVELPMLEQVFQCVWNVSSSEENQKSKALFQNRTKKRKKKKPELCLKKTLPELWWKLKMTWTQVLPRNVNKRFSKRFFYFLKVTLKIYLQDVLVCYMFSSTHYGAKEGLQTYTFWNVWEAFRDCDKQEQARAKRDGTESVTTDFCANPRIGNKTFR